MTTRSDIVPASMRVINERFHYSPGVRVGDFLFIAGQVGRSEDLTPVLGKEAQFTQAFENLKTVLDEAGASFQSNAREYQRMPFALPFVPTNLP